MMDTVHEQDAGEKYFTSNASPNLYLNMVTWLCRILYTFYVRLISVLPFSVISLIIPAQLLRILFTTDDFNVFINMVI
jgi:hypothetical protein